MFWGLVLEPGKRYSTTVEKSFHVSKAALDCSSVKNDNEILSVILETEGSESLLCNLCKQRGVLQESLDLNFMTGDRLTFECRGHGRIHLSGYLLPDEDDDMAGFMGDEESEEEEETDTWSQEPPEKSKKEKRKLDGPNLVPPKKKKIAADEDDGDSASEQDDDSSDMSEGDEDDEDGSDVEESEDEDESDEDQEENLTVSQKTQDKNKSPNKQNQQSPKKTSVTNGVAPKQQKSGKKTPGAEKNPSANATTAPKQKQVLEQGVIVKELKVGTGAPAKSGKTVFVHYIGKLKENGKVFDKSMKGNGFKFKLGKGEVIKGWDIGVQGMKVGGKRVIHCPPEAAYGANGVPPKIPPNSSLIFEVELKNIN